MAAEAVHSARDNRAKFHFYVNISNLFSDDYGITKSTLFLRLALCY